MAIRSSILLFALLTQGCTAAADDQALDSWAGCEILAPYLEKVARDHLESSRIVRFAQEPDGFTEVELDLSEMPGVVVATRTIIFLEPSSPFEKVPEEVVARVERARREFLSREPYILGLNEELTELFVDRIAAPSTVTCDWGVGVASAPPREESPLPETTRWAVDVQAPWGGDVRVEPLGYAFSDIAVSSDGTRALVAFEAIEDGTRGGYLFFRREGEGWSPTPREEIIYIE